MATGHPHKKFRENRSSGSRDMLADRQTSWSQYTAPLPGRGKKRQKHVFMKKIKTLNKNVICKITGIRPLVEGGSWQAWSPNHNGVCGLCPQEGQGETEPLVRGQSSVKLKALCLADAQRGGKCVQSLLFCNS